MSGPAVEDLEDPRRSEPAYVLDERTMLEDWLEFHRTTLLLKCEGLDSARLKRRPVPTSKLSLHGLVRHMAEVERQWFSRCFLREGELPYLFSGPEDEPDPDLYPLDDSSWEADLEAWKSECEASRRAVAGHSLDEMGIRRGEEVSLRWIFVHMVEEYARHNGHADLIREMVDGSVGW